MLNSYWLKMLSVVCGILIVVPVRADSLIITPAPGFTAVDKLTDYAPESFGTFGNYLACIEKSTGLQIIDPSNGEVKFSLGTPAGGYYSYSVWSSFIAADPGGSSLWVGFTNYGNNDDRIYQVDLNGNWIQRASLVGNFDMEFHGTTAFLSANTSGLAGADTSLWILDTASYQLREFAYVGGYTAGLGVDNSGNVYYGTYGFSPGAQNLYRFSAEQIGYALSQNKILNLSEATVLATFADANGPYDVDVDSAGNVVFNLNSFGSECSVAVWNGVEGSGKNYDIIGTGAGDEHWYSMLSVMGDVRSNGGRVYLQDWYYPGVAELTNISVPEPSSFVLLAVAMIAAICWRARKNVRV